MIIRVNKKYKSYAHQIAEKENNKKKMWKTVNHPNNRRSFYIWLGKYSQSQKEKEIYSILKGECLRFYCEVSFNKYERKRFDFYIPLLDLVIEYDGQQHFTNLKQINTDIVKEKLLSDTYGVKLIRYNKTHNLKEQIKYDLIHHPVLKNLKNVNQN